MATLSSNQQCGRCVIHAVSIPAPGHTQGHVLYHVDDRVLFTGDTLHWNHRRGEFDVFPKQTFFSWAALADTMDLIAALKVEWMFAGHGMWHKVGAEEWERQMPVLVLQFAHRCDRRVL